MTLHNQQVIEIRRFHNLNLIHLISQRPENIVNVKLIANLHHLQIRKQLRRRKPTMSSQHRMSIVPTNRKGRPLQVADPNLQHILARTSIYRQILINLRNLNVTNLLFHLEHSRISLPALFLVFLIIRILAHHITQRIIVALRKRQPLRQFFLRQTLHSLVELLDLICRIHPIIQPRNHRIHHHAKSQ